MYIRVETAAEPQAVNQFLEERGLCVPVFIDNREHIVIDINPRNRADAITLIDWLMTQ
jgi:hypothetical protein